MWQPSKKSEICRIERVDDVEVQDVHQIWVSDVVQTLLIRIECSWKITNVYGNLQIRHFR